MDIEALTTNVIHLQDVGTFAAWVGSGFLASTDLHI